MTVGQLADTVEDAVGEASAEAGAALSDQGAGPGDEAPASEPSPTSGSVSVSW